MIVMKIYVYCVDSMFAFLAAALGAKMASIKNLTIKAGGSCYFLASGALPPFLSKILILSNILIILSLMIYILILNSSRD